MRILGQVLVVLFLTAGASACPPVRAEPITLAQAGAVNWEPFKANPFLWGQTLGCLLRFDLYQRFGKAKSPSYEVITGSVSTSVSELFAIAESRKEQFYGIALNKEGFVKLIENVAKAEIENDTHWLQSMGCYKLLKSFGLVQ